MRGDVLLFSRGHEADIRRFWRAAPAIAALCVYASTLGGGYLYDDERLIRTNRWVGDASVLWQLPVKPLLASPDRGDTNYYRPLVNVVYNLAWHGLDGRPLAFHLLNVLTHMLNATLLSMLVRRITGPRDIVPVGAASLFAVHPLNSEVVAWPSCLPELGYVAFGLSAILLHVIAWGGPGARAKRLRITAYVLFGLACSCKETALAFVPFFMLLEMWVRPESPARTRPGIVDAARSSIPYIAVAAVYLAVRSLVLHGLIPAGASGLRTVSDAVLNAPWLLILYARSMVFPSVLSVGHVVPLVKSVGDVRFLLAALVVAAGIAATLRLRHTRPDLAFALCVTLVPLLPALYLPALGRDPFAERYAYLGVAGSCWLFVGAVDALASRLAKPAPRKVVLTLLSVVFVAASARTVIRCRDWRDDGTLGRAAIRDDPTAAIGYILEGSWHDREGRKEDAWHVYRDGLNHAPQSPELQQNAIGLGIELGHMTRYDVIAEYERLGPLAWGNAAVQLNFGQALLGSGRIDEAQRALTRALELEPTWVPAMTALAVVASQRGDDVTVVSLCRRALAVDERSTDALNQLGVALIRTRDLAGAIASLERAVEIDPKNAESLNRLGVAYATAERVDDARRAWERALVIDPELEAARENLGRLRRDG